MKECCEFLRRFRSRQLSRCTEFVQNALSAVLIGDFEARETLFHMLFNRSVENSLADEFFQTESLARGARIAQARRQVCRHGTVQAR